MSLTNITADDILFQWNDTEKHWLVWKGPELLAQHRLSKCIAFWPEPILDRPNSNFIWKYKTLKTAALTLQWFAEQT